MKHKNKMTLLPTSNQPSIASHTFTSGTQKEKDVDLKLSYYIAMHSAIRSVDHLWELLKTLSKEGNNISPLNKLKLHRTKCACIIKKVIGPSLLENLIDDITKTTKLSVIVDESTDISTVKYLCVCVKYFSFVTEFIFLYRYRIFRSYIS